MLSLEFGILWKPFGPQFEMTIWIWLILSHVIRSDLNILFCKSHQFYLTQTIFSLCITNFESGEMGNDFSEKDIFGFNYLIVFSPFPNR